MHCQQHSIAGRRDAPGLACPARPSLPRPTDVHLPRPAAPRPTDAHLRGDEQPRRVAERAARQQEGVVRNVGALADVAQRAQHGAGAAHHAPKHAAWRTGGQGAGDALSVKPKLGRVGGGGWGVGDAARCGAARHATEACRLPEPRDGCTSVHPHTQPTTHPALGPLPARPQRSLSALRRRTGSTAARWPQSAAAGRPPAGGPPPPPPCPRCAPRTAARGTAALSPAARRQTGLPARGGGEGGRGQVGCRPSRQQGATTLLLEKKIAFSMQPCPARPPPAARQLTQRRLNPGPQAD